MNKKNIWIHVSIALSIIVVAAIAGQIKKAIDSSVNESNVEFIESITESPAGENSQSDVDLNNFSESQPEVLVKFRTGVSEEMIASVAAANNDRIEDEIEIVENLYSIDDLDDESAADVAKQYEALGDLVEYAQPNERIYLEEPEEAYTPRESAARDLPPGKNAPNDPMFAEQWALANAGANGGKANADLGVLKAWEKTTGSSEIVVAVLDSGVDYKHEDLAENIWVRPNNIAAYEDDELGVIDDSVGFDAAENSGDPMDQNGHGTHCAGIIGASGNNGIGISGINWNVKIMPLKFMGRGGFGSTKDAIEAINYAVERKQAGVNVRVINASWGSTLYSKPLEAAIRAAGEEGILFVAAAGNSSTNNDRRAHYPSNYNLPNVVSVAALDRKDLLASFSNFGANSVHLAAPGKEILSTWLFNQYREASGTSMAAPQVAGVAALIIANDPNISSSDLRTRLFGSVDPLDILSGRLANAGRLNASKALDN